MKFWIRHTNQEPNNWGLVEATFAIDVDGYLRLANRHSEHIACAGSKPLLSVGEMFFILNNNQYEVAEVSNQSTGFCPELESWFWVEKALNKINLVHPGDFTTKFIFRRCPKCYQLNIVKE